MGPEVFECSVAQEAPLQALPPSRATGRVAIPRQSRVVVCPGTRPVCPMANYSASPGCEPDSSAALPRRVVVAIPPVPPPVLTAAITPACHPTSADALNAANSSLRL